MTLWAHFEKYNKEKKCKLAWKTKNFNFAKIDGPKEPKKLELGTLTTTYGDKTNFRVTAKNGVTTLFWRQTFFVF